LSVPKQGQGFAVAGLNYKEFFRLNKEELVSFSRVNFSEDCRKVRHLRRVEHVPVNAASNAIDKVGFAAIRRLIHEPALIESRTVMGNPIGHPCGSLFDSPTPHRGVSHPRQLITLQSVWR